MRETVLTGNSPVPMAAAEPEPAVNQHLPDRRVEHVGTVAAIHRRKSIQIRPSIWPGVPAQQLAVMVLLAQEAVFTDM